MNIVIEDIERNYQEMCRWIGKENVDFWGINLIDAPGKRASYKIYQAQEVSQCASHPLVDYINCKGMLRYFADVSDSVRPGVTRIDIALTQRNNANMTDLFEFLKGYVSYFEPCMPLVKKISKMKITDEDDYTYASLYHVGFIEKNGHPELLKFHFFTRWCKNPNFHEKDGFRDQAFLEYLQGAEIEEYRNLARKADMILQKCEGHLWMAGMDISPNDIKYKIYLKNICHAYENLVCILGSEAAEQLKNVEKWNVVHPECTLAGAAVALDTGGTSSLNLYYQLD